MKNGILDLTFICKASQIWRLIYKLKSDDPWRAGVGFFEGPAVRRFAQEKDAGVVSSVQIYEFVVAIIPVPDGVLRGCCGQPVVCGCSNSFFN